MSEEYWKLEKDRGIWYVTDEHGNYLDFTEGAHKVSTNPPHIGWNQKASAEVHAYFANGTGIRPPAPVVELPSLFLRDYVLDGDIVREKVTGGAYVKREYIKQLRAMLSALDPEPQGPWVVGLDSDGWPTMKSPQGEISFSQADSGWTTDNDSLVEKYKRITKAACAEANRIEAERKGESK